LSIIYAKILLRAYHSHSMNQVSSLLSRLLVSSWNPTSNTISAPIGNASHHNQSHNEILHFLLHITFKILEISDQKTKVHRIYIFITIQYRTFFTESIVQIFISKTDLHMFRMIPQTINKLRWFQLVFTNIVNGCEQWKLVFLVVSNKNLIDFFRS